jgi:hypothetical protein
MPSEPRSASVAQAAAQAVVRLMRLDPRHGVDREVREREQALDEATGCIVLRD